MTVRVKENDDTYTDDGVTASGRERATDLIASSDGMITDLVTRSGVPLVHQGDQVKKGDILVLGRIEVTDDSATVTADIGPEHLNAAGAVQGGMLYTLSDFAFAVLSNSLHPVTVTQSATITYIRAARAERVSATAREIVRSGHNCVVEVVARDAEGTIVCTGSFNGFISSK